MSDYILPHSYPLEDDRLMVMAKMLDPHMRFRLSWLGPLEGWKCLEVGAGNSTTSQWLADQVSLITPALWKETMALFDNPSFWTWQNSFVATSIRKPAT